MDQDTYHKRMDQDTYHEKQRLQMCAVHAINNLFQDRTMCNKASMDEQCLLLNSSKLNNPHRSLLGFGNYDINVIINFLKSKNYDVIWFDKRKYVLFILSTVVSERYGKFFLVF